MHGNSGFPSLISYPVSFFSWIRIKKLGIIIIPILVGMACVTLRVVVDLPLAAGSDMYIDRLCACIPACMMHQQGLKTA